MCYQYLIWDFDGTLFDTYPPLIQAIEQALAETGVAVPRETIAELLSDTLAGCISTLAEQCELDAPAFEARITHYWSQTTPADSPPYPGVLDLCARFLAAGGQNYIVTHRGRESLLALLDWHGATGLFADCLTRDDGYPRKPDPASFLALLAKHTLSPAQGLVIGDRALDIQAGRAAGIHTCLYGSQPAPDVQPDYVIMDFEALGVILGLSNGEDA